MSKRRPRGFSEDTEFQMAPMIDVVFLLLIFFFCVTTFSQIERSDILLATALSSDTLERDETSLVVNVHRNGAIKVHGREMTMESLTDYLTRLVEKRGSNAFEVIIRSDRKSRYGDTKDVFRACARSGCVYIKLGVEKPDQDSKKKYLLDPFSGEYQYEDE